MRTVETFDIPGLALITVKRFQDSRGFFCETYNAQTLAEAGIASVFVQDNHSLSRDRGTVRGLHFQAPPHAQGKLIRVVRGAILDVALDIRKGSPTYGRHLAVELTADNDKQLFVPAGFAHGFCTLAEDTEVIYKVTDFWHRACEGGVLWRDPTLQIAWPGFAGTLVADKDCALPSLAGMDSPFLFDTT